MIEDKYLFKLNEASIFPCFDSYITDEHVVFTILRIKEKWFYNED